MPPSESSLDIQYAFAARAVSTVRATIILPHAASQEVKYSTAERPLDKPREKPRKPPMWDPGTIHPAFLVAIWPPPDITPPHLHRE